MRYVNVLHLSDLHLKMDGPERFNQTRVSDALVADLKAISKSDLRPNIVCFSGDLANSADDKIYGQVEDLLRKIVKAAGLEIDDLFIVPGNHDASRAAVSEAADLIDELRAKSRAPTDTNSLFYDQRLVSYIGSTFRDSMRLQRLCGRGKVVSNAFYSIYNLDDLETSVICLNTAILSNAGCEGRDNDERKLLFPEAALVNAINECPEKYAKVVIGHHPTNYMSDSCAKSLENVLLKSADAYLFGHMHDANPQALLAGVGQCAFIQAGALYASRDWWDGYCIVSYVVGSPNVKISLRRWHESRGEFGVASELSDEGTVYLPASAKSYWQKIAPKYNLADIEAWRISTLLPNVTRECCQSLTSQSLDSVYVDPDFEREVYRDNYKEGEIKVKTEILTLPDIMKSNDNLIISAATESGKTALIRHWVHEMARTPADTMTWRIPVIVNYEDLKDYVSGIDTHVKQRLFSLPAGLSPSALLGIGAVTIFVDDVKLDGGKKSDALSQFVAKNPLVRYVFLTSTPHIQGAGIVPVITESVPFVPIRMKRLRSSQLLSLIEKHGTKDPKQADKLLQRMITEAANLSVPITPVTSTFFIQIYTEDASKPLINRANLLERYVEITLEKFGAAEILPGTFDFHNKADLLSDMAENMCRSDAYRIPENTFVTWITDYLDTFGLKYSSVDLLEYFVGARLLEREDGCVSFRLRAFMEYFAARRMDSDINFRQWVLDPSRYLSFPNEISFYSAISRRDRNWMEELHGRYLSESERVWAVMPEKVRDGSLLSEFSIPSDSANEAEILQVERQILDSELTEEARLELLDTDIPDVGRNGAQAYRPKMADPGDGWVAQLALLSAMLKNMELVPDDTKTKILQDVIMGWQRLACLSLGLAPALARDKRVTVAGVRYVVNFPEDMDIGEIARQLFIYLPISVAMMAYQYMGTEKLQLQLERGVGEPTAKVDAGQQFIRASLLAQLGVDNVADILERAARSFAKLPYLNQVFLHQLFEVVVRYRLSDSDLAKIKLLAADVGTRAIGGRTSEKAARRTKIIRSLTKSRLLVDLDREDKEVPS